MSDNLERLYGSMPDFPDPNEAIPERATSSEGPKKGWFTVPTTPEEDALLKRYSPPAATWVILLSIVAVIAAVEIPYIFYFATPEQVDRIMAFNGSVVIAGGAAWAVFMTLYIMYPMKRLAIRTVVKTDRMDNTMGNAAEQAKEIFDRVEPLVRQLSSEDPDSIGVWLRSSSGGDIKKLREDFRDAVRALSQIERHFSRPVPKPPLPPEAQRQLEQERSDADHPDGKPGDGVHPVEGKAR